MALIASRDPGPGRVDQRTCCTNVVAAVSPRSKSRQRLTELAHVNRYSAAGELTTSIAHELNQPLGSILTNTETAELMLKGASPDLDEIREILADIRRDDQRASEVIRRLRSVLKKTPFEIRDIDLNDTVRRGDRVCGGAGRADVDIALKLRAGRRPSCTSRAIPSSCSRSFSISSSTRWTRSPKRRCKRARSQRDRPVRVGGPRRRSGSATPVRALRPAISRTSSIRSSRPSRRAWGWGSRSSAPSSKPITGRSLPRTSRRAARCSRSGFRLPATDRHSA